MIGPVTAILLAGQVLPFLLLLLAFCSWPSPWPTWQVWVGLIAALAAIYPRFVGVSRYSHSLVGALLHPLGILVLLAIQWFAFFRNLLGRPSTWKGRLYRTPVARGRLLPARELEPTT